MGRCSLLHSNLCKEFWPYAVMTAAYIRNRCFNNCLKQTAYFAITGKKPNLSNMRVFRSESYAYKQDKKKLDPRCTKGIFLGFDKESPAYLVYILETGKVMKYRVGIGTMYYTVSCWRTVLFKALLTIVCIPNMLDLLLCLSG